MKNTKIAAIPLIALTIAVILFSAPACGNLAGENAQPDSSPPSAGEILILPPDETAPEPSPTSSAEEMTTTAEAATTTELISTTTAPITTASTTQQKTTTTTTTKTTTTRQTTTITRATTTRTTTTTTTATPTTTTTKASALWGSASQMKSDCISMAQGLGYTHDSTLGMSNSHYIDPYYSGAFSSSSSLKAAVKDYLETFMSVGYTSCNVSFESAGDGEYYIWIFVG